MHAWKDLDDRTSLSAAERATRPANPAGALVFTEAELGAIVGGMRGSTHNPMTRPAPATMATNTSCPRQQTATGSVERAHRPYGAGAGREASALAGRITRERKERSHAVCPP
jgi:mersacidin/lichenicidin family type 2 lantibiotic